MYIRKPGSCLNKEYDIFEVIPEGGIVWRCGPFTLETAQIVLLDFGQRSRNQFFAMYVADKEM